MPCDYKKYPPNWKTGIRPAILERACDHCEFCGVRNHAIIMRHNRNPAIYRYVPGDSVGEAKEHIELFLRKHPNWLIELAFYKHPIRIVLTVAHLDHDITNNVQSNLAALCQRCHLRYDRHQHTRTRRRHAAAKKGLR
jgi:hypothetical protein